VNNLGLSANLKGLKKKPGTAPPPDLGVNIKLTPGYTNRVEMVYVNSQQPVHGKVGSLMTWIYRHLKDSTEVLFGGNVG
jgi:hypothetical protein